jgi:hypothetical protein
MVRRELFGGDEAIGINFYLLFLSRRPITPVTRKRRVLMHVALIVIFAAIVVAPLWGRRKVHAWVKKNMPEELSDSYLAESHLAESLSDKPDVKKEHLISVREDRA